MKRQRRALVDERYHKARRRLKAASEKPKPLTQPQWRKFARLMGAIIVKVQRDAVGETACVCLGWEEQEPGSDAWFSAPMARAVMAGVEKYAERNATRIYIRRAMRDLNKLDR